MMVPIGRSRACGSPSKTVAPLAEGRQRRDEPHDRAREAAVDGGVQPPECWRDGCYLQVRAESAVARHLADVGAQLAQRPDHQGRVPGMQRRPQTGRAVGQGSEHEVPVGQ